MEIRSGRHWQVASMVHRIRPVFHRCRFRLFDSVSGQFERLKIIYSFNGKSCKWRFTVLNIFSSKARRHPAEPIVLATNLIQNLSIFKPLKCGKMGQDSRADAAAPSTIATDDG
jgi:hypothetical protein